MQTHRLLLVAVAASFLAMPTVGAYADGPEVEFNAGAAIPLSKYRRTVDGDLGGTFGVGAGYRFDLTDHLALSLLGQPQFTFLPTEDCCGENGEDVSSMFIITGGPRLTLTTGQLETYVGGQGGYYRDISGVLSDDGPGFNVGGGLNFKVSDRSSVGVYARYDQAYIDAAPNSDQNRQFLLTGLAFNHVFRPEEPVRMVQPPPPAAPAPPPAPPVQQKLVLRGVNFDFDKSNIRPDAQSVLNEAATTLQARSDVQVSVEGHTDSVGTDAYNQKLSERRAASVADYLSRRGVSRSRMQPAGYGESRPVATNVNRDGRAQNRRVELKVL